MTLATVEANTEPPQQPRMGPPYSPATQLCSFTQRPPAGAPETFVQPCSCGVLFTGAELRHQPGCPARGEWIKMAWHTCAVKFYPVISRKMDIPGTIVSERQILHSSCLWSLDCMEINEITGAYDSKVEVGGRGMKETMGEGWQRMGSGERRGCATCTSH